LLATPGQRRISAALIASLCFLQFFRAQHWETEGRPDAASSLFAFAALWMFYRMQQAGRTETVILYLIAGTSLMLIGFFFKQPAIAVAIVPLVVTLKRNQLPRIQQLLSLTPLAAGFACLVALRAGFPWVYNYMITTPGSYPISGSELLAAIFELIRMNILFVIAVMVWQFTRSGDIEAVDLWLLVTIVVTGLSGAAGRAKPGGYYNSYLPALLAMSMFTARVITTQLRRQPLRFAIGTAALLAVDLTALSHSLNPGRLAVQFGDSAYVEVIAAASRLPGKVVCLDDPSIPLVSKGSIGRSGECEMDANHRKMPDIALSELQDADWVIQLTTARHPTIPSEQLRVLGFGPAPDIFPYESVYSLWKRTAQGQSVRI
jgi:4-amino-4-deoxy-L-arabinose transferase-like glycosyltransferase